MTDPSALVIGTFGAVLPKDGGFARALAEKLEDVVLVILLPLVCGLMIGCLYLWRRLEARMPGNQGERLVKVRETMMVSTGTKIAVLEFENRLLLVSVSRNGVTLLDRGDK